MPVFRAFDADMLDVDQALEIGPDLFGFVEDCW